MITNIPEDCPLINSTETINSETAVETCILPNGTTIEEIIKFYYIVSTKIITMPEDLNELGYLLCADCLNCPFFIYKECNPNIPIEPFIKAVKDFPPGTEIEAVIDIEPVASKGVKTLVLYESIKPQSTNIRPKPNGPLAG